MKRFSLLQTPLLLAVGLTVAPARAHAWSPKLDVEPQFATRQDVLSIHAFGLSPNAKVTISAATEDASGIAWTSAATFQADRFGALDLAHAKPVSGSYDFVNAMGLIWSMSADPGAGPPAGAYFVFSPLTTFQLTLSDSNGKALATSDVTVDSYGGKKINAVTVTGQPFVATYYQPADGKKHPAIVVLGGSDPSPVFPQLYAEEYAAHGFAALAVSFFGVDGLPADLNQIPLEYFAGAIHWLAAQPEVDGNGVFISGQSKGGEAALLVAATYPNDVKGVVADSGSSFVWQGIVPPTFSQLTSSWTLNGVDFPFVPYDILPGDFATLPLSLLPVYERSLTNVGANEETSPAAIPVENINGPVLMTAGGNDQIWPATTFSTLAMQRLDAHHFRHLHAAVNYPRAGHLVFVPFQPTTTAYLFPYYLGGDVESNGLATADQWQKSIEVLLSR